MAEQYRIPRPFTTLGQVETYLSQPRIQCLLCGELRSSLGAHLAKVHKMTGDEYRVRFGIPYSCPLACPDSRKRWASAEQRHSQDPEHAARRAQRLADARRIAQNTPKRHCPTMPDACDRLDDALLQRIGKAARMEQLRAKLAEGAADRAQARKERRAREHAYYEQHRRPQVAA